MHYYGVANWDTAYSIDTLTPGVNRWPHAWVHPALTFRNELITEGRARLDLSYSSGARNKFDLFLPIGSPRGLVLFVHGGFWMQLDKSYWSHFAKGALHHGYAVAMPSYTLCPQQSIGGIVHEVALAASAAAEMIAGPIHLIGHSAGGHLVTRMVATNSPLMDITLDRVATVVSISGLHDLRPLMKTEANRTLALDENQAISESPALLRPKDGLRLCCWVGSLEPSEFVRQSLLLANVWLGLGASTASYIEPDRHHFDVIDGLLDPYHPILSTLAGPVE